jgi:hypothetical protein
LIFYDVSSCAEAVTYLGLHLESERAVDENYVISHLLCVDQVLMKEQQMIAGRRGWWRLWLGAGGGGGVDYRGPRDCYRQERQTVLPSQTH